MKDYNVILKSTFSTRSIETFPDEFERKRILSCKFGGHKYHHLIRESVMDQLLKSGYEFDDTWDNGREAYIQSLRRTLISICAPGHGQYTGAYQCTLRAGTMLFAHSCLNDIHYLPNYDLIDGVDFISYNLFNFVDKLRWVLSDPEMIHHVRMNGQHAIQRGYNIKLSAAHFFTYLEAMAK